MFLGSARLAWDRGGGNEHHVKINEVGEGRMGGIVNTKEVMVIWHMGKRFSIDFRFKRMTFFKSVESAKG